MKDLKTIIVTASEQAWRNAQKTGQYAQSTISSKLADAGFIHATFPDQTIDMVNRHFTDRIDVVLLFVDSEKVKGRIRGCEWQISPVAIWAESNDLLMAYYDTEWGVPVHDDRQLFEILNLECAQAGLSWLTILGRRDCYRQAFNNFDSKQIAEYGERKRAELLLDEGIIRNRLKVNALVENAKAMLAILQKHGSLDAYLWGYIDDQKLTQADHDRASGISQQMSKGLKKNGFRFVGPAMYYAFMQAVGMINDHAPDCFRYEELGKMDS